MTTYRSRLLALAVGLMTAGSASAATLSVYAKMAGTNAVGNVVTATGSDPSASINCFTNGAAGCVDSTASGNVVLEPGAAGTNATFTRWVGCATPSAWLASATYAAGAIVSSGGAMYRSLQAANTNNLVTDVAWWAPFGANACYANLASSKTVTAYFAAATQALQVKTYPAITTANPTPAYGGYVTAATTPAIDCQTGNAAKAACATIAAYGSSVVLTAVPGTGAKVQSWAGCASVSGNTCTVSMNAAKAVSATFGANGIGITASVSGPGSIRITEGSSVADGMFCPGDCSAVATGTGSVTVSAIADAGAKFVGWSGLCSGTGSCSITATQLNNKDLWKNVGASFKGSAGGACGSCHAQPVSHLPYNANCGDCHTGYSEQVANASLHMNGTLDLAPTQCAQPPAAFSVAFDVVGAGFNQVAGPDQAYVDVTMRLDGVAADPRTTYGSPGQWNGTSGSPRFSIGEVLADGSFKSVLLTGPSTTTPGALATSQTSTAAMWTTTGTADVYRFTFSASGTSGVVPQEGLDLTKRYRAVMYGARYFVPTALASGTACSATQFPTSDYGEVVPAAGGTPNDSNDMVSDAKCNGCHGAVNLHGRRRGVAICLTCHNSNTPLGTGNTVAFKWDLKNLVHKIHSGQNYDGINPMTGEQGTAWGTTMDASHMAQGPSHTLYFEGAGTATTATTVDDNVHQLPTEIQCSLCHTNSDHLVASQAGCSSCHPINWVTGAGHGTSYPTLAAGETGHPHTDAECAECHPANGPIVHQYAPVLDLKYPIATVHGGLWEPNTGVDFGRDFTFQGTTDATARTVTAVPTVDGVQRHKPEVDVVGFTVDAATGKATITVDVKLDGVAYTELVEARAGGYTTSAESKGAAWPTCAFTLAGPAESDYVIPANGSNNLSCATFVPVAGTPGRYTTTPTTNLNVAAYPAGTYTLSYEMMYSRQGGTPATGLVRKPFAVKPNFYTVTKADPVAPATTPVWAIANGSPRRAVVSFAKCNNCHIQLGFHSNQSRQGPDYCAVCHNPMLDNSGRDRVKFADARDPAAYGARVSGVPAGQKTYLVESVSANMFIHRIHMGGELPSVANPNQAGPWVPEPGRVFYGATRAATVGSPDGAPPSITDLSEFAMPNPMGRCDQCHETGTWAMPETARAPVVRRFKLCAPITYLGEEWCNPSTTNGPATVGTLYTPPIKAVCTSCHDDIATDSHADAMTTNPMTQTAQESCLDCHGASAAWDVLKVHPSIP